MSCRLSFQCSSSFHFPAQELESLEAEFSNEESEEQLLSLVDKERELLSIASSANGFRLESSDHSGMLISLADGAGLLSMTYTEDGEHATTTFQTATASVPGSFTAGLKNTALSPELTALVHQWAVPELQSAHATPLEVQEVGFTLTLPVVPCPSRSSPF